jgi:hypothetical protein
MEWAPTVFIVAGTLALLCGVAALPRGLLIAAFLTVLATVAVVVLLEVAQTYHKPANSPQLLARRFPRKEDRRVSMTLADFLTAACKLVRS